MRCVFGSTTLLVQLCWSQVAIWNYTASAARVSVKSEMTRYAEMR